MRTHLLLSWCCIVGLACVTHAADIEIRTTAEHIRSGEGAINQLSVQSIVPLSSEFRLTLGISKNFLAGDDFESAGITYLDTSVPSVAGAQPVVPEGVLFVPTGFGVLAQETSDEDSTEEPDNQEEPGDRQLEESDDPDAVPDVPSEEQENEQEDPISDSEETGDADDDEETTDFESPEFGRQIMVSDQQFINILFVQNQLDNFVNLSYEQQLRVYQDYINNNRTRVNIDVEQNGAVNGDGGNGGLEPIYNDTNVSLGFNILLVNEFFLGYQHDVIFQSNSGTERLHTFYVTKTFFINND